MKPGKWQVLLNWHEGEGKEKEERGIRASGGEFDKCLGRSARLIVVGFFSSCFHACKYLRVVDGSILYDIVLQ